MSNTNGKKLIGRLLRVASMGLAMLYTVTGFAAAPGITGPSFNLVAEPAYISQPDGASIYSWGYGCNGAPAGFAPANITTATCSTMQIPGPTLVVHEGDTVTVTLTNNLPAAAGNTSILFPGFDVTTAATSGVQGILTKEAVHGGTVTYTFMATNPGTHAYYSGTQGDVQVEMGLYGAIIVLPNTVPTTCHAVDPALGAKLPDGQPEFRLAASAYDHPETCYDREYLFQLSELDPSIHSQAEAQATIPCTEFTGCMTIQTEPYHPAYFLLNGRSMPDNFDPNYAVQYPHQPYNGNPHAHPGELVLMRFIGTGRWQHPFHEHGNHLRMLAHDGNLMVSQTDPNKLGGRVLFTTTTTPGQAFDAIFYWTGRGLNWDIYGHVPPDSTNPTKPGTVYSVTDTASPSYQWNGLPVQCIPDTDGYFTANSNLSLLPTSEQGLNIYAAPNYHEWCQDHDLPLEKKPFGAVGAGGPVTLPDSNLLTNGAWYGGSPYLGPDATVRAIGPTNTTPPSGTVGNPPSTEAGYAFIWHSHNERELTTNNIFPGGIMTMFMVDPQVFVINEAN